MTTTTVNQSHLGEILAAERPRLLGLCTYLTGDPDSAEDVVQEVLLEAWRSFSKRRDPDALDAWLNGIVRNVCARWQRSRSREAAVMRHDAQIDTDVDSTLDTIEGGFDLEVELDRQELALLLDRALALLPATMREVLIGKYIVESPHAELARRLGLTENAVTVRLHRGKLALRKLLTTELRDEAATFGLVTSADSWTETRLWCPECSQRHVMGKLTATEFALRCPTCSVEPNAYLSHWNWAGTESPVGQLKSFRSIHKQLGRSSFDLWMAVLQHGEYCCPFCHRSSPIYRHLPAGAPPSVRAFHGMHVACERCQCGASQALYGLAACSPAGLAFFQAHPRQRLLPERELEFQGAPAIVQSFASVTEAATFEVIFHRDTFATLAIYQSGKK